MPRTLRWEPPTTPFMLEHVAPLGVTSRVLRHAHTTERLVRLAHGVYIAAEAVPEDPSAGHVLRAHGQQLLMRDAVASHVTAALAWGIDLADDLAAADGPPTFTRPSRDSARSRRSQEVVLHVRDLPPQDRVMHPSGLLVTTPARAAVDVAATLDLPEALVSLDSTSRILLRERVGRSWLRDEYTKPRSLELVRAQLSDAASRAGTLRTHKRLDDVVSWADPRRESPAESLSFGHMVLAGLPLPELQVRLTDEVGDMYPDFLWRAAGLVGEVDGLEKYRTADDLIAERRREARLRAMGLRIVRWEGGDIRRSPSAVMARLGALLAA